MLAMLALGLSAWATSYAQLVEPKVPGDNFSLEGALELFKQSDSPEEFERLLNARDSKVNNLDLNSDGYIDYIRVLDRYEGNVHAFIIQAVISERENQDIAVIELEKLADGKAVLQIIGNEEIYGIETIIEPTREVRTHGGAMSSRTVVNVWTWPSVQYVYSPYYSGWVSPWGWRHRPIWWRRWTPVAYVHYYPIWDPYRPAYGYCETRRIVYAYHIYRPFIASSVVVRERYRPMMDRYRSEYSNGRHRDRYRQNEGTYAGRSRTDRPRQSQDADYNRRRDQEQRGRDASSLGRTDLNDQRSSSRQVPVVRPTRPSSNDRRAAGEHQTTRGIQNSSDSRQRVTTTNGADRRGISTVRPNMERHAPYTPQRSVSRERPSSAEAQRSNSGYRRSESPGRSPAVTRNPGIPQQPPSRPSTLNRNRPLPPQASPQRSATRTSGSNQSKETKRGRY